MRKGIEIIGGEGKAATFFAKAGITVGAGEGYLPVFADFLNDADLEILAESYLVWSETAPLLESVFNSRLAYGTNGSFARSGSLNTLTREDADKLSLLGIKTVIDMSSRKVDDSIFSLLCEKGISYVFMPLHPTWISPGTPGIEVRSGIESTYDSYRQFLAKDEAALKEALELMSKRMTLVCCSHGKDRTGLLSALYETSVGIEPREVLIDYSISYWNIAEKYGEEMKRGIAMHFDKILLPSKLKGIFDSFPNDER